MDIFVMYPDGCGQKQLVNELGYYGTPAWSRDRKRIAFTTNRHTI